MRIHDLPSPGSYSNSQRLRIEAAKTISAVEISAAGAGGSTSTAEQVRDFFLACSAAVEGLVPEGEGGGDGGDEGGGGGD